MSLDWLGSNWSRWVISGMAELKLSIIIPTKDRYETLTSVVNGLLCHQSPNFELVISDNSKFKNELPKSIRGDSRVKYMYSQEALSMRDNCAKAVRSARGLFLIMIGDDDFVDVAAALEATDVLRQAQLDFALSPSNTFYWPHLRRRLFGARPYGFEHCFSTAPADIRVDPSRELRRTLEAGGCSIGKMPRLYQGLVRRSCVDLVTEKVGKLFNAPMPDMSSSTALAITCKEGLLAQSPFIINGVSSNSGGGKGASGKHSGLVADAYGLTDEDKRNWPKEVRPIWTGGTVWAASLVLTLNALGKGSLLQDLNRDAIDGYLLAFHPKLAIKHNAKNSLRLSALIYAIKLICGRISSLHSNCGKYLKLSLGVEPIFNDIHEYHRTSVERR